MERKSLQLHWQSSNALQLLLQAQVHKPPCLAGVTQQWRHHPHSWRRLRKHVSVRDKVTNMSTSVCFYVKKKKEKKKEYVQATVCTRARVCVCVCVCVYMSARRDLLQRRISELKWKSEILDFLFQRLSILALRCLFTSPMGLIQHVLPEFNHTNLHFSRSSIDVTDPWCHGSYHDGLHPQTEQCCWIKSADICALALEWLYDTI